MIEKQSWERKQKELTNLPFEYKYLMAPMEATMPLDYEINDWVRQAEQPAGSAH